MAFNNATSTYVFIKSCVFTNFTSKNFPSPWAVKDVVKSKYQKLNYIQRLELTKTLPRIWPHNQKFQNSSVHKIIASWLSHEKRVVPLSRLSQVHLKLIALVGILRFALQSQTLKQSGWSILSHNFSLFWSIQQPLVITVTHHTVSPLRKDLLTQLLKDTA